MDLHFSLYNFFKRPISLQVFFDHQALPRKKKQPVKQL